MTTIAAPRQLTGRSLLFTGLLAFLSLISACAPLPDVGPFSAATTQLADAQRASGRAASDEVAEMTNGEELAKNLRTAWQARNAAMDAMTSYAGSLAAIVQASNDAGNAAASLAEKVGNLASAAGIINPAAGPSIKVATDTAKLVWTNIARAKGAADLQDALDAAQPAIEIIAETMAADGKDLRLAIRAAITNEKNQVLGDKAVNAVRGVHLNAAKGKAKIIGSFDIAAGQPLPADKQAQLDSIDQLLNSTRPEFESSERKLAELETRKKTLLALVGATDDALTRWAAAHQSLTIALRERRPIDMSALLDGIVEIRDLIKKVRDQ